MIRFFFVICLLIPLVGCLKDERTEDTRMTGIVTDYRTKKIIPNIVIGIYSPDSILLGCSRTNEYGRYDVKYPVDTSSKHCFLAIVDSFPLQRPAYSVLRWDGVSFGQKAYRTKNLELVQFGYLEVEVDFSQSDSFKIVMPTFNNVEMVYGYEWVFFAPNFTIKYSDPINALANEPLYLNYSAFKDGRWIPFSETYTLKPGEYVYRKIKV